MSDPNPKLPKEIFGWSKEAFTEDPHVVLSEYLLIFIILVLIALIAQFYVGKVLKWKYFPEIGATILLGMVVSGILRLSGANTSNNLDGVGILGFSSPVFFIGLLPPIIFNSGYQLKRRLFFANLDAILALAVIGTTLSAAFVGLGIYVLGLVGYSVKISLMEALSFGSLISATDPVSTLAVFSDLRVDPTLFYLVFGESVLNDAIGIVLFKTTSKYIGLDIGPEDTLIAIIDFCICFVGSCVIGYSMGLLSAAIASRRYINKNIPSDARYMASFVFELMAYLCETTVFLSLGMSVIDKENASSFSPSFIGWSVLLCLLGRALHVYPLLGIINYGRKLYAKFTGEEPHIIPLNTQHMIFFSGLRGAVAYACANIYSDDNGNRALIQTTSMVIILLTIFAKGGGTILVLKYLDIPVDVDPKTAL
eukprot:gene6584-13318_t